MLDRLTVDTFAAALGGTFTLDAGTAGTFELELTYASTHAPDAPAVGPDGVRSPFSIRFRGPSVPVLAQHTYELEHPDIGPLAIFVVPIGSDAAGTTYEAVFA